MHLFVYVTMSVMSLKYLVKHSHRQSRLTDKTKASNIAASNN